MRPISKKTKQFRKELTKKIKSELENLGIEKEDLNNLNEEERIMLLTYKIAELYKDIPKKQEPLGIKLLEKIITKVLQSPLNVRVIMDDLYEGYVKSSQKKPGYYPMKIDKLVKRWKETGEIEAIIRKLKAKNELL